MNLLLNCQCPSRQSLMTCQSSCLPVASAVARSRQEQHRTCCSRIAPHASSCVAHSCVGTGTGQRWLTPRLLLGQASCHRSGQASCHRSAAAPPPAAVAPLAPAPSLKAPGVAPLFVDHLTRLPHTLSAIPQPRPSARLGGESAFVAPVMSSGSKRKLSVEETVEVKVGCAGAALGPAAERESIGRAPGAPAGPPAAPQRLRQSRRMRRNEH